MGSKAVFYRINAFFVTQFLARDPASDVYRALPQRKLERDKNEGN